MGERRLRTAEVVGSNPIGSTSKTGVFRKKSSFYIFALNYNEQVLQGIKENKLIEGLKIVCPLR